MIGRPVSTGEASKPSTARVKAHEAELVRRGGAVVSLRLKRATTEQIDLCAMQLRLNRSKTVHRLIQLALYAGLDKVGL